MTETNALSMSVTNGLLILFIGIFIITIKIIFARLAVIHALTNSGMGSALTATVVALTSDAKSKRELAKHIGGKEYVAASEAADIALQQGKDLLLKHTRGQSEADRQNNGKFFK